MQIYERDWKLSFLCCESKLSLSTHTHTSQNKQIKTPQFYNLFFFKVLGQIYDVDYHFRDDKSESEGVKKGRYQYW